MTARGERPADAARPTAAAATSLVLPSMPRAEDEAPPAKRAAALTHRLLAFSRRQTLDPRPTNVNRLIAGMSDLLHRTFDDDDLLRLWDSPVDTPSLRWGA